MTDRSTKLSPHNLQGMMGEFKLGLNRLPEEPSSSLPLEAPLGLNHVPEAIPRMITVGDCGFPREPINQNKSIFDKSWLPFELFASIQGWIKEVSQKTEQMAKEVVALSKETENIKCMSLLALSHKTLPWASPLLLISLSVFWKNNNNVGCLDS